MFTQYQSHLKFETRGFKHQKWNPQVLVPDWYKRLFIILYVNFDHVLGMSIFGNGSFGRM